MELKQLSNIRLFVCFVVHFSVICIIFCRSRTAKMVVSMATIDDHERKVCAEFAHLLEQSKNLFNGLRLVGENATAVRHRPSSFYFIYLFIIIIFLFLLRVCAPFYRWQAIILLRRQVFSQSGYEILIVVMVFCIQCLILGFTIPNPYYLQEFGFDPQVSMMCLQTCFLVITRVI